MKYLILFILTINCFGQKNSTVENELLGCWIDSREENIQYSETKIYRHCNFKKFPISRFRFFMNLNDNNECNWLYLAPNDRHRTKKGTWKFNKETMIVEIHNADKELVKSFKVIEVEKEILKIEFVHRKQE